MEEERVSDSYAPDWCVWGSVEGSEAAIKVMDQYRDRYVFRVVMLGNGWLQLQVEGPGRLPQPSVN